ncbi:hypothetical protein EJ08DRAFT_684047 [Tothia fuscella]|uniref:Uncharacterized protein n=1 Tax=Tothia fuscella TaxID=1048955 RepID=A0A9P4NEK0_9PEZI|nr:hypothetical protein EJ08DRAFT_684047 [Tothia fuscella]
MSAVITSLKYGDVSVTDAGALQRVQTCIENYTPFLVNNKSMGGDTVPGKLKHMVVDYTFNGLTMRRKAAEDQTVNFAVSILKLKYGMEDKFLDYDNYYGSRPQFIQAVYKAIDMKSPFAATNQNLLANPGQDDPTPGKGKRLIIDCIHVINPGRGYPQTGTKDQDYQVLSFETQENGKFFFNTAGSVPQSESGGAGGGTGGGGDQNIWYVDLVPAFIRSDPLLRQAQEDMKSTWALAANRAEQTTKARVGSGEVKDRNDQNAYRAKVCSYGIKSTPWLGLISDTTQPMKFNQPAKDFHKSIINAAVADWPVKLLEHSQWEKILEKMGDTIKLAGTSRPTFLIVMTLYQKDDLANIMRVYIRAFYFPCEEDLSKLVANKSRAENIDISVTCQRIDAEFDSRVFSDMRGRVKEAGADGRNFVEANTVRVDVFD